MKTSQKIFPPSEIQVSAYKHFLVEDTPEIFVPDMEEPITLTKDNIIPAILQVGYKHNKRGYKFTPIEDKFKLFKHAQAIWKNETEGVVPLQKDYPFELKL